MKSFNRYLTIIMFLSTFFGSQIGTASARVVNIMQKIAQKVAPKYQWALVNKYFEPYETKYHDEQRKLKWLEKESQLYSQAYNSLYKEEEIATNYYKKAKNNLDNIELEIFRKKYIYGDESPSEKLKKIIQKLENEEKLAKEILEKAEKKLTKAKLSKIGAKEETSRVKDEYEKTKEELKKVKLNFEARKQIFNDLGISTDMEDYSTRDYKVYEDEL